MKHAFRLIAVLAATLVATGAAAQNWPTKPVKIIVPFTAGSATDILARTFGQKLSDMWGQPVIVENHPGAGGTIGAGIVAKAPPDGYTLLVHSAGIAVNPWIYPDLPYDTGKDFAEIAPLGGQPNVLVVAPEAGIKSVQQARRAWCEQHEARIDASGRADDRRERIARIRLQPLDRLVRAGRHAA
jgi:tripartite-type tricarboxylate transporter receptor subunit TctC